METSEQIKKEISKIVDKMTTACASKYDDGSGEIRGGYIEQVKAYNEALRTLSRALVDIEYIKMDKQVVEAMREFLNLGAVSPNNKENDAQ